MKKLLSIVFVAMFSVQAWAGELTGGIGSGGGGGGPLNGFFSCTAGVCTALGSDGSTQFVTGNTNGAVEWIQAMGGTLGGGGNAICRNSPQTGNVNCNWTAQGTGGFNFSNGNGVIGHLPDPGGSVVNVPNIGFHDVQFFSASGTWTRPTGIVLIHAKGCGGGGSGGSGALDASGTAVSGGGGGGGAGCFDEWFRASDVVGNQVVTIGAGGAAVAGQTTSSTAGLNGNIGNITCFGNTAVSTSLVCAGAGGGGAGGQIAGTSGGGGAGAVNGNGLSSTTGAGGAGAFGLAPAGGTGANGANGTGTVSFGGAGAGTSAVGVAGSGGASIDACGGGGGGGGLAAGPASNNGGVGGIGYRGFKGTAPPTGGTTGTPTGGSITPALVTFPGYGGGGGYGNSAGTSGGGGAGTQCGGGGGGGTALNGSTAGASGKGGDGWMIVESW